MIDHVGGLLDFGINLLNQYSPAVSNNERFSPAIFYMPLD